MGDGTRADPLGGAPRLDGPGALSLPPGRSVNVPGRGAMFVREMAGPPGAPTLLLAHGIGMTADLNWLTSFVALGGSFRVIAPDLRGHGDGPPLPSGSWFRLEDCADDLAALAGALGVGGAVAVGYSMGGLVAQCLWRRHPDLVEGLVLCSTSTGSSTLVERAGLLGMAPLAASVRLLPPLLRPRAEVVAEVLLGPVHGHGLGPWALWEMRRTGLDVVALAGHAVGMFDSRSWVGAIDVPAAVVVTGRDHVVPTARQEDLARRIPGATVHLVDAGHGACLTAADRFVPALLDACRSVAGRAARPAEATTPPVPLPATPAATG